MASSATQTTVNIPGSDVYTLTVAWTADTDGTFTAVTTDRIDGYVMNVVTNPGATAPTADYDITLSDTDGVDIMGGELLNRHTSSTEQATPLVDSAYAHRYVAGALTVAITNNSVNTAVGTTVIYFYR